MIKKPRIAFIVPDKIAEPVGGMGVQAKYLIKHLEKDFDFDVYAFPEENSLENYHSVFNPLPRIQHHGVRTLTSGIAYLAEIIQQQKPDLIHVADYTLYLPAVMASRALKIPLVASVQLSAHLMEQEGMTFSIQKDSIDGQAIQNAMKEIELLGLFEARKIIHVAQTYKDAFKEGIPELDIKAIYIPNGIELSEWKNSNKIKLPGSQDIKLVYLGRFSDQKNIQSLVKARVPENVDLIFVGDPTTGHKEYYEEILKRSTEEENIHYFGPAYDQKKIDVLCAADAIIIPSVHECHPIIMHEALASKSVVLSSFVNDMAVVLDENFALNCGTTSESIERSLEKLSKMNPKEIQERQEKGLEVVQDYTWKKAAQKTKKVYENVLGK